jgi:serine/threonine-protein kinase
MFNNVALHESRTVSGSKTRPKRAQATRTEASELPTMLYEQRQLGRYRLCLKVATGGMASVYLARLEAREDLHRLVALKVLHPRLTRDPDFADMFFDEARIATLIRHPYVCSVFDFDVVDGSYFLAMELLVGESLRRVHNALVRERERGDPAHHAACVARMLTDACEGLHAAHELRDATGRPLSVVHRDIAPDNLFLTHDGIVKVVDFGVASAARRRHRTRTGIIKGKLAYIAPEVFRGARPDRRTDVWGIGAVLWEMLTLRRLFHRSTDVATLGAVLDAEIPAPSTVRAGLPKELDAIVMRALAREPKDRYETARALGRDLSSCIGCGGRVVDNATLCDWMDRLFPGGRIAHQRVIELAAWSPHNEPTRPAVRTAFRASAAIAPRSRPKRRWWFGLAITALVAALLAFALLAHPPRFEHRQSSAEPSRARQEPATSAATVIEAPSRAPVVLELGVTREGGEHQTLLRIRPEPQGDFRVEEMDAVAAPEPK